MDTTRRQIIGHSAAITVGTGLALPRHATAGAEGEADRRGAVSRGNPIGVSTYSYWRFRKNDKPTIDECIRLAGEAGFDGVEVLEIQMHRRDNAYCQELKRAAMHQGMSLFAMSTHQDFVDPDPAVRADNVFKTISSIELAYSMGIPTIRVNTGRWGTTKSFDDLMKNRGIEPPIPGFTDEDAFPWVIESLERCLPSAERAGVVLGLENHWGLGITPEGVLRIVDAINSPWLRVTCDTGNFLENPYDRLATIARKAALVQAKTYYGGGVWYTLDLDYARIATIFRDARFHGWVSLEFEGTADTTDSINRSLAMLRQHFGT